MIPWHTRSLKEGQPLNKLIAKIKSDSPYANLSVPAVPFKPSVGFPEGPGHSDSVHGVSATGLCHVGPRDAGLQ